MTDSDFCTWKENYDGFWETTCGHAFVFNDGSPKDNSMNYCCYCGKPLKEALTPEL